MITIVMVIISVYCWCSKRRVVNTAIYQLQDDNNSYWFGNQHLLQLSTGHINDTTKFFIVQHVFYRRWFSFQRKETQEMDEGERYKNTNDPASINDFFCNLSIGRKFNNKFTAPQKNKVWKNLVKMISSTTVPSAAISPSASYPDLIKDVSI